MKLLKRVLAATALGLSLLLAACDTSLDPDDVDVTGPWTLGYPTDPSDFDLDLVEQPDGTISGTWSFPSLFANHRVWGTRDGLEIELTADSPNHLPVRIRATLVSRNQMDGDFYFGGVTEAIILRRGTREPPQ